MSLGRLFVSVGADTKEFERAMDGMQKSMANAGKKIGDVGKGMTKWVTGPLVGAGAGLLALANKTAESGDEIQKMSLRTGFSTEALSEFRHAANLSGTSVDSIEKGVKRMSRVLLDAERGLEASERALGDLGLAVEDLQGLAPEEQFDVMSRAIADIEDPTKRAALAQEIFGRAGTDLLPMLSAGAEGLEAMRQEARDLGIVFDQEGADAAAKFKDDMERLKQGFAGVFQELGTKLIPIITDDFIPVIVDRVIPAVKRFIDRILDVIGWFQDLSPTWQRVIGIAIGFLAALGPILIVVGKIIGVLSFLVPIIKGVGVVFVALTSPIGLVIAAIVAAIAIGWLLWKNWDKVVAFIGDLWDTFSKWFMDLWETVKDAVVGFAQALGGGVKAAFQGLIRWATGAWESYLDFLDGLLETMRDVVVGFAQGIWDGVKEKFQGLISWATEAWEGFRGGLAAIWEGIETAIKGSVNVIIGLVNGMIGGIESGINFAISAINSFIRRINRAIERLNRVPGVNLPTVGTLQSVSIGRIPTLHGGGQFRTQGREGLALLEDKEWVLTESQMAAMSRDVNHTGTIRVEGVNSKGQMMDVVDIVMDQIRREVRATS